MAEKEEKLWPRAEILVEPRVARWFTFNPKFPIWVNLEGHWN
jgi:hypothetical protein